MDRMLDNEGFMTASFLTIVAVIILAGWAWIAIAADTSYADGVRDEQRNIEIVFENDDAENQNLQERNRTLASNWLHLNSHLDQSGSRLTEPEKQALEQIQETGEVPVFEHEERWVWSEYHPRLLLIFLGGLAVFSAIVFITYACQTVDRSEFLLDLPWKRVWPFFFVAFTAFPLGLPFYIVSAIRLARHEEEAPVDTEELGIVAVNVEEHADAEIHQAGMRKFYSSPNAALATYIEFRTKGWQDSLRNAREAAQNELNEAESKLRKLSEKLRSAQARLNTARAQLKELNEREDPQKPEDVPDLMHLNEEFERLMKLPGVQGVRVINGQIGVLVMARLEYDGKTYDLGDWEIRFGGAFNEFTSMRLRSGTRSTWHGGYPSYILRNGEFCFGPRLGAITQYVSTGKFLEALDLAVDCMQSVNPEDRFMIPEAFKEAVQ